MEEEKIRGAFCPKIGEIVYDIRMRADAAGKLSVKECKRMKDCGVASEEDMLWSECYFMQHRDELQKIYDKPYMEK